MNDIRCSPQRSSIRLKILFVSFVVLPVAATAQTPITLRPVNPVSAAPSGAEGVLPAWNDRKAKKAIIDFVTRVTTADQPGFVPAVKRVAVFDNDGTLWCEQPLVQLEFTAFQLRRMAKEQPELREQQPWKAAYENDRKYLRQLGLVELFRAGARINSAMSPEKFYEDAQRFFRLERHPRFNVPYQHIVYRPMRELLDYLRAHGFQTYICSGGSVDFIRTVSPAFYGIPESNVIGTSQKKTFQIIKGRWELTRTEGLNPFNDRALKPVNVDLHIGQRPLIAVGNVRSGGDIELLRYSHSHAERSLQLLINHDDAAREYAYAEKDGGSLKAAADEGWRVVSIRDDWNVVFPESEQ